MRRRGLEGPQTFQLKLNIHRQARNRSTLFLFLPRDAMSEIVDQLFNADDVPVWTAEPGVEPTFDEEDEEEEEEEEYETDSEDDDSLDTELAYINAQLQWEESVDQLKSLVGLVILPLIGKVLGRRFASVIWRKVMDAFY